MSRETLAAYVLTSSVREQVLATVVAEPTETETLIDETTASESAVYKALGELRDRDLVVEADDRWRPTGVGILVSDALDLWERARSVVDTDRAYWRAHDVSVVPEAFRERIGALDGCEVVRATETDPTTVQQRVLGELDGADSIRILSEVRHEVYAAAIDGNGPYDRLQFVFDQSLVDHSGEGRYGDTERGWRTDASVRIADVSFTLCVVDGTVLLSLPDHDGTYDTYTEVVAETPTARRWASRLFGHYWATATPLATYVD